MFCVDDLVDIHFLLAPNGATGMLIGRPHELSREGVVRWLDVPSGNVRATSTKPYACSPPSAPGPSDEGLLLETGDALGCMTFPTGPRATLPDDGFRYRDLRAWRTGTRPTR